MKRKLANAVIIVVASCWLLFLYAALILPGRIESWQAHGAPLSPMQQNAVAASDWFFGVIEGQWLPGWLICSQYLLFLSIVAGVCYALTRRRVDTETEQSTE
ncbi:MAG: hypothetical protein GC159_19065 [Phycisphaera sp.]|nr:hypothetical protein [Phycisphaera sp.]